MDTITQGLLGAVTAQLGFRRRLGRSATWAAAFTAVAADLDVLIVPALRLVGVRVGPFDAMLYHRGISHSLFFVPVLALVAAGVWYAFRRKQLGWLYLCCLVAAATHPLLDACTSYGTQLLMPLSRRRVALDAVPIIDILYTPLLVLTLAACWTIRRLAGRRNRAAIAAGWVGLVLSVGYLAAGRAMHDVAVGRAREACRLSPSDASRIEAYPSLGTIFVWRVVVRSDAGWDVGRTHLLFDRPVRLTHHADADGPHVRKATADRHVGIFDWFASGQLRPVNHRVEGERVVDFHDMRYGVRPESPTSLWMARVRFDADGNVASVRRVNNFQRRGGGRAFSQVVRLAWRELFRP